MGASSRVWKRMPMQPLHLTRMSVMLILVGLAGCAARGGLSALENELRQREDQISELDRRLEQANKDLAQSQRETNGLRSQLSRNVGDKLLPEQSDLIFRAERIEFSEYLTSGVDRDGKPGDEMVSILLTPRDSAGDPIRLPGKLKLEVLDLNNPEGAQVLGRWTWDESKITENWHKGFLSSGYHLEVPWSAQPRHRDVTLRAQLTTPDGREFTATHPIEIRLAGDPPSREVREADEIQETSEASLDAISDEDESVARDDKRRSRVRRVSGPEDSPEHDPFEEAGDSPLKPGVQRPAPPGGRQTKTSDRFRSFDPPRYQ